MITLKRIGELIAQEKGCYVLDNNIGYVHLKLKYEPEIYTNGENNFILYVYCNDEKKYKEEIFDEDLFETLEEAEWYKEFGCIERTERLELPTWEEFIEMEEVCFWKKNHRQTVIRILGTKYIAVETSYERFFTGDLTKENYILACRKAKELFLGESYEE